MHDMDRTQQYFETGPTDEFEMVDGMQGEFESPYGSPLDPPGQAEMDYVEGEFEGAVVDSMTGEIALDAEMDLASELLSVASDAELDQFLGRFVRRLGKSFRRFARSGLGRTLGGVLRNAAKAALPTLGGALGTLVPIPGVGTALGAAAGQAAGSALGLEGEGLSPEDREFEVARRIVRIGIAAARQADGAPSEDQMQGELLGVIGSAARSLLPGVARAVLGGVNGAAAGGSQFGGGLSGGLDIQAPGGWRVSAGGQAGGHASAGGGVGVSRPAPQVPFAGGQPWRGGRGSRGPSYGGRGVAGRWIRRGRHILILNAF